MAVDKSYGSGKSRSAANSSARRRVAADQMTKGKKSPAEKIKAGRAKMAASPLGQLADTVLGFALPTGKVATATGMLLGKGKLGTAATMAQRLSSKSYGRSAAKEIARNSTIPKMGQQAAQDSYERVSDLIRSGRLTRGASQGVFPRGTDLAERALKAKAETKSAARSSQNYEFSFDRFVREADRIERKYGLNMRTAEEGIKQAAKRIKPRKTGGR